MREIRLNGAEMTDRVAMHAYLKRLLELPDHYGNNLDALWDCLTSDFTPRRIVVYGVEAAVENLGLYGEAALRVLREAAEENACLQVIFEAGQEGHGGPGNP